MSDVKIFLIEDSLSFQKRIHDNLSEKLEDNFGYLTIDIVSVDNVIAFYNSIEGQNFSSEFIFIIDIDLNTYFNGIALGSKIRKQSSDSKIIFLTSFENKAIEIINEGIFPKGYILKSQNIENVTLQIINTLKNIISEYTNADLNLLVDNGFQKHIVPYKELIYITIMPGMRNSLLLKSINNEILFSGTLSKIKKELTSPPFILNLKSFIINFDAIMKMSKMEGTITFKNDLELFIGKQGVKKIEDFQKGVVND